MITLFIFITALEPVEEIQIVNVSERGSIELPCMKGTFPNPTNISWWRNNNRCDSQQQCQLVSDNLNIVEYSYKYKHPYCVAI